jgi:F-type H+-transporting ATPase subunit a
MQAFIFAMLTMLNIAGGVPWDDWNKRRAKRNKPALEN